MTSTGEAVDTGNIVLLAARTCRFCLAAAYFCFIAGIARGTKLESPPVNKRGHLPILRDGEFVSMP